MENNILNAIDDLGVPSTLRRHQNGDSQQQPDSTDDACKLSPVVADWNNYSALISWVGLELKVICPSEIDETVTPLKTSSIEDLNSFKMELSSLLKELGFPYSSLLEPQLPSRFESIQDRTIVLSFLLSELQAARMIHVKKGKFAEGDMNVSLDETPTAKVLKEIMVELDLGKPPPNTSPESLWVAGILPKVKGRIEKLPLLEPLFSGVLTQAQWTNLDNYFKELKSDYGMRREMLLKRLDVTVQSFHWSDRLKGDKEEKLNSVFKNLRPNMKEKPAVELSDVLAARSDLAIVEKTSSTSVRKNTRSAVNSVVIGKVPDRGGRPDEVEPPPPEMPSWQQRQAPGSSGWIQNPNQRGGGGQGGAGGRGGGGNRGGGRVQGGWSNHGGSGGYGQGDYQQRDNYQQQQSHGGGGGYHQQGDHGGGSGGYHQQGRGGSGYFQHDNRDNSSNQGGDNFYQGRGGGHRGRGGGYHEGGGGGHRGGGRDRRY